MGPHERWTALLDILGRDGEATTVVLVADPDQVAVLVASDVQLIRA